MEISESKKAEYIRRLIIARTRLLCKSGFYGLLLMHARFMLDPYIETAATDGETVFFCPEFMDGLSDRELDFVLMHEITHIALGHCARVGDRDRHAFNIACDIVVNSNIMHAEHDDKKSITLSDFGVCMHTAPNGKPGYLFTAEQVYDMLPEKYVALARTGEKGEKGEKGENGDKSGGGKNGKKGEKGGKKEKDGIGDGFDDHSLWTDGESSGDRELWEKRIGDAVAAVSVRDPSNARGLVPVFAERLLDRLRKGVCDWRQLLHDFVQENVCDYSFCPPDRRYDGDFFLPDFNEKDVSPGNVLFMIDTSASMSNKEVADAYSEVKAAVEQFDGRLMGMLGFFDAAVIPPVPFCDESELLAIKPKGGGGTNFNAVFDYVKDRMQPDLPTDIVILTDGYAPFPDESVALGVPVLWLITNDKVTPPWGKVARL